MLMRTLLTSCATPRGEPADRFELLRLAELLLELPAFRDVADEPGHRARVLSAPTRATVNSTGNSVPSARTAISSICLPERGPRPVARYWRQRVDRRRAARTAAAACRRCRPRMSIRS